MGGGGSWFYGRGVRYEAPELAAILDTRRGLDAAGDVKRVGIERRGLRRVLRRQSARDKNAAQVEPAERVEPARLAGAAEKPRMKRVDQNEISPDCAELYRVERRVRAQPQRSNHRHRPSCKRVVIFVAMKLQEVELE